MTPSELLARVRVELAETSQSFFNDDAIYSFMCSAEDHIAKYTRCLEGYTSGSTTNAIRSYSLPNIDSPTNIYPHLYTVDLRVDKIKMQKITMNDMDVIEGNTASTGTPQYYYEWGSGTGAAFYLIPTPTSTLTWELWYIGAPTPVGAGTSSFSIPDMFTDHIGDYVLWRCFSQDNMLEKAAFHKNEWESALAEMSSTWAEHKRSDKDAFVKDIDLYRGNSAGVMRYLF